MSLRMTMAAVLLVAVCCAAAAVGMREPPAGVGFHPPSYKLKLPKGESESSLMALP